MTFSFTFEDLSEERTSGFFSPPLLRKVWLTGKFYFHPNKQICHPLFWMYFCSSEAQMFQLYIPPNQKAICFCASHWNDKKSSFLFIHHASVYFSCLVKFEACHLNERISFESSDPKFSVRPDGSLYAEQDVTNLSEPVQFMVTAQGSKNTQIWETTVKLAIAGHPLPPLINQVRKIHFLSHGSWALKQIHKLR